MIPKILSQTWKSARLPDRAAALQQGWRALNPGLDYRFYDDDACRAVIAEAFPQFLADYDALPQPVMRADVFRYAVLFRDGGVYADIDMECLRPVAPLLEGAECLVSVEAHLGRRRQAELGYRQPLQIANCVLAAAPRHLLFRRAVERSFEIFRSRDPFAPISVEDVTGPRMLTRLVFEDDLEGVAVLPQIVLMAPLEYPNVWPINRHMYARHRTFGTWKTELQSLSFMRWLVERNRLPNPLPFGFGPGSIGQGTLS
jgi:mannosyltransferase OCH1-like enzyme